MCIPSVWMFNLIILKSPTPRGSLCLSVGAHNSKTIPQIWVLFSHRVGFPFGSVLLNDGLELDLIFCAIPVGEELCILEHCSLYFVCFLHNSIVLFQQSNPTLQALETV